MYGVSEVDCLFVLCCGYLFIFTMAKINPDFLLRDELQFEVSLRGEVPAKNVLELRKQLRGLLRSGKAISGHTKEIYDSEKDLEICQSKCDELVSQVGDLGDSPDVTSTIVFRLRLRLEHLLRRVKFWAASGLVGDKWDLLTLETQVAESIAKLQCNDGSEREEEGVLLPPVPVAAVPGPSAPIVREGESGVAVTDALRAAAPIPPNRTDQRDTSTLTGSQLGGGSHLSLTQTTQPVSQVVDGALGLVTQLGNNYCKLPNPLSSVLGSLSIIDGLQVDQLLNFIEVLFRAKDFPGMSDTLLLQLIFPHCQEPLLEILVSCLESGANFEEFHTRLLENFVPGRLRENLRQQKFYRLQKQGEELASFVSSIKLAAKVLKVGLTEKEIVNVIIEGVTPEERSRLVFTNRPHSFADLTRMCITSAGVAYNDILRQGLQSRALPTVPVMQIRRPQTNFPMNRPQVCFGCGQPGHIRRFCLGLRQPQVNEVPRNPVEQRPQVPKNLSDGKDVPTPAQ